MAKIQVAHLKRIGTRYGALEPDTGVPTVNLSEGVALVHETGRDLAFAEGRFFSFSIAQAHAASGTLDSVSDPQGALNVLNQTALGVRARWQVGEEDLWLLSAAAVVTASGGLTLTSAQIVWEPGANAPGLSSAAAAATNTLLFQGDSIPTPLPPGGGIPIVDSGANQFASPFPYFCTQQGTSNLRWQSVTGGAGTMTVSYTLQAWLGPIDVVPPFA